MDKLTKKAKYRIAICATAGTLIGGTIGTCISNSCKEEKTNLTYPIILDDVNTYGVTTQKYYIKELKDEGNEVIIFDSTTTYKRLEEIIGTKYYNTSIDTLELSIYTPWSKTNNYDEEFSFEKSFHRNKYTYYWDIKNITKEELQEKVALFENGQIKKMIEDSSFDYRPIFANYADSITEEEMNNSCYSAELTVRTVDYNDIYVTKESKRSNEFDTYISLCCAAVTGSWSCVGGLLWDYELEMASPKKGNNKSKRKK